MEIYVIRHGKTVWNMEKRLQGSTDIGLSEEGIDMAMRAGKVLKDERIDAVFASPLSRAYDTAKYIVGSRDLKIQTDDRLRELCFGEFEGHTADELNEREGCTFKYFFDKPHLYVPGEGGETLGEACLRAQDFMEKVILPLEANENIKRVMIVAHGAMNKAIRQSATHEDLSHYWDGGLQQDCGIMILEVLDGVISLKEECRKII